MQVDPKPAAATVYVATPSGELSLPPGREVVARVVSVADDGAARISLAGQVVDVTTTNAALRAGDEVRLSVSRADSSGVRLAVVPTAPQMRVVADPAAADPSVASRAGASGGGVGAIIDELARAGVPVTPQLTKAVGAIAEQLGGGSAATRAVANLAGRDLVLSPAAAGRVVAALEIAGSIGPSLASLAARSAEVAAALPTGTPTAGALRALLAPNLSSAELAVARIVQATQASAPGGPVTLATPPSSSAAVIQNYVSSQVAVNASLDDLAAQNTLLGTASLLASRGQGAQAGAAPPGGGLAANAIQAALRGQSAAGLAGAPSSPVGGGAPGAIVAPGITVASAPGASSATAPGTAQLATSATKAAATAAAATGAAAAAPTPTNTRAAQAVADLAQLAVRFTPALAPGALGTATATIARGMSAVDIAQQAGRQGSVGAGAASVAGAGADGDPTPLVTAIRTALGAPGSEADTAKLLRTIAGASPEALATAIRTMPESQTLRLAGALLDALGQHGQGLSGPAMQDLGHGVHHAIDALGKSLVPPGSSELAALRAALEHVAANDVRPAVAADASRLLAATEGQQLLSRTASGSDPGYVYFQVPMPDGRGAEVLVRRDPGRRQVTFDEFRIAFLLDTDRLGTLMISLDAHPAGIRADVRTDVAELEPFLRAQAEALVEPLARESRRQVTVTTGLFEQEPPKSLLEPTLGATRPGGTEFYA